MFQCESLLGTFLHSKTAAEAMIAHAVCIVALVTQISSMLVTSCRHASSYNSKIDRLSCSSAKFAACLQSSCISSNGSHTVKQAPLSNQNSLQKEEQEKT